jgi:hypothetical protein
MRNGPIGIVSAMAVAWMMTTGCGGGGAAAGTGGSPGGGTGGSSGATPVTTLSGTKAVGALTAAEAMQLCRDTYAYFGSAIPKATACKWKGLAFAASSSAPSQSVLQQNCTSQESGCLQAADPWANNPGCSDLPTTCTATVAQYAACIGDEVAAFVQIVNGMPACAALTSAGTAAIFDAQSGAPPASCASLGNSCPDLYPPGPLNQ